jgi:aspartyl protease family protein
MQRRASWNGARRAVFIGVLLWGVAATAQAQSVAFSGMLGDRALLIIDGQAHTVPVGGSSQGVKLLKLDGNLAQVDIGGKTQNLHLGAGAVMGGAGGGSSGSKIILPAGLGGHFTGLANINGHSVQFVIDTGATTIAMGLDEAKRIGLDLSGSALGRADTANGVVTVRTLTLTSVRVGDVTVTNVEATVLPQPMPYVLLGNSFLSRFQMRRDNDTLVLEKK